MPQSIHEIAQKLHGDDVQVSARFALSDLAARIQNKESLRQFNQLKESNRSDLVDKLIDKELEPGRFVDELLTGIFELIGFSADDARFASLSIIAFQRFGDSQYFGKNLETYEKRLTYAAEQHDKLTNCFPIATRQIIFDSLPAIRRYIEQYKHKDGSLSIFEYGAALACLEIFDLIACASEYDDDRFRQALENLSTEWICQGLFKRENYNTPNSLWLLIREIAERETELYVPPEECSAVVFRYLDESLTQWQLKIMSHLHPAYGGIVERMLSLCIPLSEIRDVPSMDLLKVAGSDPATIHDVTEVLHSLDKLDSEEVSMLTTVLQCCLPGDRMDLFRRLSKPGQKFLIDYLNSVAKESKKDFPHFVSTWLEYDRLSILGSRELDKLSHYGVRRSSEIKAFTQYPELFLNSPISNALFEIITMKRGSIEAACVYYKDNPGLRGEVAVKAYAYDPNGRIFNKFPQQIRCLVDEQLEELQSIPDEELSKLLFSMTPPPKAIFKSSEETVSVSPKPKSLKSDLTLSEVTIERKIGARPWEETFIESLEEELRPQAARLFEALPRELHSRIRKLQGTPKFGQTIDCLLHLDIAFPRGLELLLKNTALFNLFLEELKNESGVQLRLSALEPGRLASAINPSTLLQDAIRRPEVEASALVLEYDTSLTVPVFPYEKVLVFSNSPDRVAAMLRTKLMDFPCRFGVKFVETKSRTVLELSDVGSENTFAIIRTGLIGHSAEDAVLKDLKRRGIGWMRLHSRGLTSLFRLIYSLNALPQSEDGDACLPMRDSTSGQSATP